MAASAINSFRISKLLGIEVQTDKISREKIVVPEEIDEEIEKKEELYDEKVNKKTMSAATLTDKLKIVFKKGKVSQEDQDRRSGLTQGMKEARVWANGVDIFFVNCKRKEAITPFLKKVEGHYKKLNKKGYINNPTKIQYEKFDHTNYLIDKKKDGLSYGQVISNAYKDMYEPFKKLLEKYDKAFKNQEDRANETRRIFTKKMDRIKKKADKVLANYKKSFETVKKLVDSSDSKDDPKLTAKMGQLLLDYKHYLSKLTNSVGNIDEKNFTALFLHLFKNLKTIHNMEALPFYSGELNDFYDTATSASYSVEELKDIYNDLMDEQKELEGILKEFTNERSEMSTDSLNKLTKKIEKLEEKIKKIYGKIGDIIREFDRKIAELKGEIEAYKLERNKSKKREKLFIICAVLGTVISLVGKLYPLIDAAMFPAAVPVSAMPK